MGFKKSDLQVTFLELNLREFKFKRSDPFRSLDVAQCARITAIFSLRMARDPNHPLSSHDTRCQPSRLCTSHAIGTVSSLYTQVQIPRFPAVIACT
jgi:hypothetical protein